MTAVAEVFVSKKAALTSGIEAWNFTDFADFGNFEEEEEGEVKKITEHWALRSWSKIRFGRQALEGLHYTTEYQHSWSYNDQFSSKRGICCAASSDHSASAELSIWMYSL
jgi:hypothetical protein